MYGSTLYTFKRSFIEQLQGRTSNVAYESPMDASDVMGDDGSGATVYWDDTVNGSVSQVVFTGPNQHWFDEQYTLKLVIQVLGSDTSADQMSVDDRATQILGEAIALLSTDPTGGVVDTTEFALLNAHPSGWQSTSGVLAQHIRAVKYVVDVEVDARIILEST